MKISELYEAVSKLGFEDSLEDNNAFYHALNRATVQINDLRPKIGVLEIFHKPLVNRVSESSVSVREVFENVEYSCIGAKAFYFEVLGSGSYEIKYETETGEKTAVLGSFNEKVFTPFFDLIKDEDEKFIETSVRLRLFGEYIFHIRNVALYDRLYGPNKEDIPAFSEYKHYDVSQLTEDFLALEERPIMMEGHITLNTGFEVEDGRIILLRYDSPGVYKIRYKKKAPTFEYKSSPMDDDSELLLDEDLCGLLPLLIASYVWIDDEPEKAQYYLNLYSVRAKEIVTLNKKLSPLKYETNGW